MKQFEINGNNLTLRVQKSPVFIRTVFFVFTFLFFALPLMGVVFSILSGGGFHVGFLIGLGLFGLMGFYLLRVSLWNTYGCETICFAGHKVNYQADYGWFRDGKKEKEIVPLCFSVKPIGYEEDHKGVLIIGKGESIIESVTKMPVTELEELINALTKIHS